MQAAWADQQRGGRVVQAVALAALLQADGAAHRVHEVHLAVNAVGPGGAVGVLEVRHEHARAAVERIDDHLAVHRPGDLHAAVLQVGGQGADLPVSGANVGRVPQEVGEFPGVQAGLTLLARLQQLVAARAEPGVQFFQKGQGTGGQDAAGVRVRLMLDSVSGGLRHLRFSSG